MSDIKIKVEFGGGIENMFECEKMEVLIKKNSSMQELLVILEKKCLHDVSLFIQDEDVCPGILVLINNADWELEGMREYVLKNDDCVVFISTLHGG